MTAASPLYLRQMEIGPMENFVYLVGDAQTREVLVVDPAWQADTILRVAREQDLKIVGALISHYHFDHTNGIEELLGSADVPVYVNKHDVPYLDLSHDNIRPVDAGQVVKAGRIEVRCVHTPGHTPGSQCFHTQDHLVSGDTLFIGACGRTDLPGGDAKQLYDSLRTLSKFDDRTVLCPGHNYSEKPTTTLGDEKRTNPYLLCDSLDHFLRFRTGVSEYRQ
ncbi:MAG: putative polyketide biosynthesis zinc-dependent hydrolase PksB [Candidatus Omnitrophica bacterium]|nr:putative polyketide biosynthesis zinc-dependent hydrolase PksB [Candidatus Omnitrophota bacterium]